MANLANKNNKLLPIKLILIVAMLVLLLPPPLNIDILCYFISLCYSMIKSFLARLSSRSWFLFLFYAQFQIGR
jgi:hypothetical protein